ncbi:BAG family molecular chaperone regulator 2-like [Macadamia integrifolia]|uniref:BAG family molecular chaperone regulator 2-like n=1 Tax=Macadamia integrifolia TaxID=60698 RepID=UPI001C4F5455|nr:BAG family molecular chaperone regulator 2-like [Macadamia integrifolia]
MMMMRKKKKMSFNGGLSSESSKTSTTPTTSSSTYKEEEVEWEMRPGGMLVQKRCENEKSKSSSAPILRLRISYGALRYEISINSQSTFGELKKLLAAETGLQPAEQRLLYRGKERENGEYLDMSGVKDRSKLVLVEDPASTEKRFLEMRRNAKIQSARCAISDVALEVDKLDDQVSAIEKSIANGNKVPEVQITTLIEMLMRQAIKLDSIPAEGDVSAQKNLQGKRVQKCVESLDVLKVSNARIKPVVVTTNWETFESPITPRWEFFN